MTDDAALALVRNYYAAYQHENPEAVTKALRSLLDVGFILDSPMVREQLGGPANGPAALVAAVRAAPFLKSVTVETLYGAAGGHGAAALIHFSTPMGPMFQSEHFDIEAGHITRLRSYYDPRALLQLRAAAPR